MKSVRTFVKRKPEFEALLSRFVMRKGENTSTKDCCVLNLSTKSMRLASGEEKMLLKSQNLFNVLNAVACIYNRIGLMVNERSADLFLKLRGELSKMYARENIESKIRSELYVPRDRISIDTFHFTVFFFQTQTTNVTTKLLRIGAWN